MRVLTLLALSVFAVLPAVIAQEKTEAASASQLSDAVKYEGEVRDYDPGKALAVEIGRMKVKAYDLTDNQVTYAIEQGVSRGSKVNITETDAGGRHIVSVTLRP
jgi:hypothetical protein